MERGTPPRSSGAKPRERGSGGGSRAAPAPLNRWAYRIEPPLAVRDLRHLDLNRHSRRRFEAEDVARRVVARSGRDTSVRRHGDDLRVSEPAHIGIDLARYPEVAILGLVPVGITVGRPRRNPTYAGERPGVREGGRAVWAARREGENRLH